MGDSVREQMEIAAPAAEVMEVLLDIERYPEWARDLKEAEILARDDLGRVREARFRAAGFGYSTQYTLSYDHSVDGVLSWVLTEGDVTRKLDGAYHLTAQDGTTSVVYELEAELVLPIPGFVKRRTAHKITHTALRELKERVEGLEGASE